MLLPRFLCLIFVVTMCMQTNADVDVSAGSYSCFPCGRLMCGMKDGGSNLLISPPQMNAARQFEPRTCKEIQTLADARQLDPEECSFYTQVTMAHDDPCECMKRYHPFDSTSTTSQMCVDPALSPACNLCGAGKEIGDPERFMPASTGYPLTCISLYDEQVESLDSGMGGFGFLCTDMQSAIRQHCQCVTPGTCVDHCILQDDVEGYECTDDSQCCSGTCKYIHGFQRFVCTHRESDGPPPNRDPIPPPRCGQESYVLPDNPRPRPRPPMVPSPTPLQTPPGFFGAPPKTAPSGKPCRNKISQGGGAGSANERCI